MAEKTKDKVIAICYDFDKTLGPSGSSFGYGYFDALKIKEDDFWAEERNSKNFLNMDKVLSYLYFAVFKAKQLNVNLTKQMLESFGKNVHYYEGVESWFERINNYAKKQGYLLEHYIISSGLKEVISNCSIAKYFKKIYANSYIYDDNFNPIWPAYAINATNKTQYLYRIRKNTLNESDNSVNDKFENYRVPFKNMIYVGDSETDIPCMRIVIKNGGTSIGVYDDLPNNKNLMIDLYNKNRINNFCVADYSKNSEIEKIVKKTIDKIKKDDE